MRLLLDTHVAIWMVSQSDRVPGHIKALIADGANEIFISSVTILEIAIKHKIGKPDAPPFGGEEALRNFESSGYGFLPVSPQHAAATDRLEPHHRDPFDRILIAQAIIETMPLVTRDIIIRRYQCPTIPF